MTLFNVFTCTTHVLKGCSIIQTLYHIRICMRLKLSTLLQNRGGRLENLQRPLSTRRRNVFIVTHESTIPGILVWE